MARVLKRSHSFHRSHRVPASAGKAKAGIVHSVSGWTRGVQVKLWDPLRTCAIPEHLRVGFTTRCYTNPRLPLPLPLNTDRTANWLPFATRRDLRLTWWVEYELFGADSVTRLAGPTTGVGSQKTTICVKSCVPSASEPGSCVLPISVDTQNATQIQVSVPHLWLRTWMC